MIFQEPMTSLNPVFTVRRADRRGHPPARGARAPRRDGQDGRDAQARPHPQRRAAGEGVSAPALGRHAAADHDRHGAVVQSEAPDRRRADHRARRDDPGADPRAAERAEGQARHGHHADHPRHGRHRRDRAARRRDVRRPGGRGGAGRRAVQGAAAPLHAGAAALDPAHRSGRHQEAEARADPGHGADAARRRSSRAAASRRAARSPSRCTSKTRPRSRKSGRATRWPASSTEGPPCQTPLLRGQATSRSTSRSAAACSRGRSRASTPSTTCPSTSCPARRWGSSASRAAASRRPAARSSG